MDQNQRQALRSLLATYPHLSDPLASRLRGILSKAFSNVIATSARRFRSVVSGVSALSLLLIPASRLDVVNFMIVVLSKDREEFDLKTLENLTTRDAYFPALLGS